MANAVRHGLHNTWIWMAAAFGISLGLGLASLAISRNGDIVIALATTARVAFLFFWPAYVGGALTSLFGGAFAPLKEHARELGLAFAAALSVHLSFVAYLCLIGHAPGTETFIIFGTAAAFTYLLALLSIGPVRRALPSRFWPPIRFVAMNYIALAFLLDFKRFPVSDLRENLAYLPFTALAVIGLALRFAAWLHRHLSRRSGHPIHGREFETLKNS
jgi:hypothetical protein